MQSAGPRIAPGAAPGPTVLEALTYRHFGHSRTDPATYRPADEVEQWLARDPLDVAAARLTELGVPEAEVAVAADRRRQDRG